MNKRLVSMALAVIMLLGLIPSSIMATGENNENNLGVGSPTDVRIKEFKLDKTRDLTKGDGVKLTLTLDGDAENIDYIEILNSDSFYLDKSGSRAKVVNKTASFNLIYNGGSSTRLNFKIYYKDNKSTSDYIDITNITPYKEPEKIEPEPRPEALPINLVLISDTSFSANPGSELRIPLEVRNASDSSASNVVVTASPSVDAPFIIKGGNLTRLRDLYYNRTDSSSLIVEVDDNAKPGNYPITVKMTGTNPDGKVQEFEATIVVRINELNKKTNLVINRMDINPNGKLKPNDPVVIGFEIENKGEVDLSDISVSLDGLGKDSFYLFKGINLNKFDKLGTKEKRYISYFLQSPTNIQAGSHELSLIIKYKDKLGNVFEDVNKFYLNVERNLNNTSSLIIENIKSPTGSIGLNQNAQFSIDVRNRGQVTANNISVSATSQDMEGLAPVSSSVAKLDNLKPGESANLVFDFKSTSGADKKNYLVKFEATYLDSMSTGEPYTVDQFAGVFINAPDKPEEGKESMPKLIIDNYSFEPRIVEAGQEFEMKLSFYNTNSQKTIKNIKIFLTSEPDMGQGSNAPSTGSSVFTPVDSSNTFYIDSIPPKGRVEKTIKMFTIPEASAKTHEITANLEYEDSKFTAFEAKELIGIPVVQQARLEIGDLNIPEYPVMMGDYVSVSAQFFNTGKTPLYNMMVKLEGDFQTENGNYYVGNFNNGSSEYFEGSIIPSQPGEFDGALVFSFEDSTGKKVEERKEFKLTVEEPVFNPDDMPEMEIPEEVKPLWKRVLTNKFFIGFIVLIVLFSAFKFIKKRKEDKDLNLDV